MAIQIPPAEAGPSSSPYKLAHTLSGHSRSVTALRYSNDGKVLVSAGEWGAQAAISDVLLTCRR